ncbi:MAG: WD40 repeat domain-containing protein [Actinomycetota bacterium]|nr:WD40 repeat domain-containing protein [Actinomycetota bacterium]
MKRQIRKTVIGVLAISALFTASLGSPAAAEQKEPGEGEGLKFIKNLDTGTGTDHEYETINGRVYAFATSRSTLAEGGGVHVIDMTVPEKAKVVHTIPCVASQGDIQISHDSKTLMVGLSSTGGPESCTGVGKLGFITIDITNPLKPEVMGFAETNTSHNITAHPKKPFVYNSTSALAPPGNMQIWSIKNPAKPKLVNTVPSLPNSPHDVSFSKDGKFAVTAAISHWDIFDTTDPANPQLIWTGQCPGCSITHDAKFTPDGNSILVGDEAGGGMTFPCPGGAWYFYDFSSHTAPVLTGVYEPAEFVVARGHASAGGCTSHVFDVSEDGTKVAISWYTVGTRYLDISSAIGATVGANRTPTGILECGWYIADDGNSWSSKFHPNQRYITSNDIARGFDIFKITAEC